MVRAWRLSGGRSARGPRGRQVPRVGGQRRQPCAAGRRGCSRGGSAVRASASLSRGGPGGAAVAGSPSPASLLCHPSLFWSPSSGQKGDWVSVAAPSETRPSAALLAAPASVPRALSQISAGVRPASPERRSALCRPCHRWSQCAWNPISVPPGQPAGHWLGEAASPSAGR